MTVTPLDPLELLARDVERLEAADVEIRRKSREDVDQAEARLAAAISATEGRTDARFAALQEQIGKLAAAFDKETEERRKERVAERGARRRDLLQFVAAPVLLFTIAIVAVAAGVPIPGVK